MSEVNEIKKRVAGNHDNIINFLHEICAIPSMDGQLKDVGDRIQAEMRKLNFAVDGEKRQPGDVAREFLLGKKLISGSAPVK